MLLRWRSERFENSPISVSGGRSKALAILSCPGCDQRLRVPDDKRGTVTCPVCGCEWFQDGSPETSLDQDSARTALDELFTLAGKYNSSQAYLELMRFVGRFRFYSAFNAMLIHTQMPGARFVCTARRWLKDYCRKIKISARPIVILQPKGPVLFVFDAGDTTPLPNAPPLPHEVENPFEVRDGKIGGQLVQTIENAKRDGVRVSERADGSQSAGSIQWAEPGQHLEFAATKPPPTKVELRFELLLNSAHSAEARYGTLVHELAHLYCGHLGTPDDRWWPDRRDLSHDACEFEAESVSYLVCTRLGINTPSDEYLAAYVRRCPATPPINLDRVMKAVGLIEQMGHKRLGLRKGAN
jgi:hypothetical protein